MKFVTYQRQALRTAVPTALDFAYLIPMIVGEIGELFGAQAKAVRDGWSPERLAQELAKEYGDICWGVAVAMNMLKITPPATALTPEQDAEGGLSLMQYHASQLIQYPLELDEVLPELWCDLKASCLAITAHTFDQVLEMNLSKLTDRAHRGTIQGQGNDR